MAVLDKSGIAHTSHLRFLILQHRLQLLHHKLTDGACWGLADTHHGLENKDANLMCMYNIML